MKQITGREQVGRFDLYSYAGGAFGLANGNQVCYFSDRQRAVEYGLREAFGFKDPAFTYDVGFCELRVYAEKAVSVVHAGDDRSFTVHKWFDSERDALDYANGVNRKYHGVFEQ